MTLDARSGSADIAQHTLSIRNRAGASPEAVAYAVGISFIEEHGGEKASALADLVVKAVQDMSRAAEESTYDRP